MWRAAYLAGRIKIPPLPADKVDNVSATLSSEESTEEMPLPRTHVNHKAVEVSQAIKFSEHQVCVRSLKRRFPWKRVFNMVDRDLEEPAKSSPTGSPSPDSEISFTYNTSATAVVARSSAVSTLKMSTSPQSLLEELAIVLAAMA